MSDSQSIEYFEAFRQLLISSLSIYADRAAGGTTDVDERYGPYVTPARMRQIVAASGSYSRSPFEAAPKSLVQAVLDLEGRSKKGKGTLAIDLVANAYQLTQLERYYLLASAISSVDEIVARYAALLNDSIRSRTLRLVTLADLMGVSRSDHTVLMALEENGRLVKNALVDSLQGSSLNDLSGTVPKSLIRFLQGQKTIEMGLGQSYEVASLSPLAKRGEMNLAPISYFLATLSDNPVLSLEAILDEQCEIFDSKVILKCDLRYESAEKLPKVISAAVRDSLLNRIPLLIGPISRGSDAQQIVALAKKNSPKIIMWGANPWSFDWVGGFRPPIIGTSDLRRGGVPSRFIELSKRQIAEEQASQLGAMRLSDREIVNIIDDFNSTLRFRSEVPEDLVTVIKRRQDNTLESLSTKIVPVATMNDLIIDNRTAAMLHTFKVMVESRLETLSDSQIRIGGGRGAGIAALFSGPSGTGKTMAAEVVAKETGLDLYVVNLAGVVDKYVGETEKNLKRIFEAAERVQGILLFDEADSLFGRRGSGEGSNERYSNMEIAHLLQLMESFNGVAILTTNLRSNLDDAFTRRLDVVIDFPALSKEVQQQIWLSYLSRIGSEEGIDVNDFVCFDLSGGEIRNVISTAAFLAKEKSRRITAHELYIAVSYELRKSGRLCRREDFGEYFSYI